MARKWVLHGVQSGRADHGYHCPMRDLQFDDMHLFARVADLGTLSAVARGKIMVAAREGKPMPEGWAIDAAGRPKPISPARSSPSTTISHDILQRSLLWGYSGLDLEGAPRLKVSSSWACPPLLA